MRYTRVRGLEACGDMHGHVATPLGSNANHTALRACTTRRKGVHAGVRQKSCGLVEKYNVLKHWQVDAKSKCQPRDRGRFLLLGVIASPTAVGLSRRMASRRTWMTNVAADEAVLVRFIMSAQGDPHGTLRREATIHRDLLLVDAPETPMVISDATKYSNYTRRGRGMPTFKIFAFFRHAAAMRPRFPFVGHQRLPQHAIPRSEPCQDHALCVTHGVSQTATKPLSNRCR